MASWPVHLTMPAPWFRVGVAAGSGAVAALLGAWRASKRASKVCRWSPTARPDSSAAARRSSRWSSACSAWPARWRFVAAGAITPLLAIVVGILLPEVVVVGVVCFGRVVFPWLGALLARDRSSTGTSRRAWLRDHVRSGARPRQFWPRRSSRSRRSPDR